jgi:hypothetical protein
MPEYYLTMCAKDYKHPLTPPSKNVNSLRLSVTYSLLCGNTITYTHEWIIPMESWTVSCKPDFLFNVICFRFYTIILSAIFFFFYLSHLHNEKSWKDGKRTFMWSMSYFIKQTGFIFDTFWSQLSFPPLLTWARRDKKTVSC